MAQTMNAAIPVDGGAPIPAKEAPPPPYGTPKAAEPTGLPRVCDPLERAPNGCKRFKIRAETNGTYQLRYVLVKAGKDAEREAIDTVAKSFGIDPKTLGAGNTVARELPD